MDEPNNVTVRPRGLCRKLVHLVLHSSVLIKAQVLLVMVLLGSALQSWELVPDTVFSDKRNPINKYLVKYSWFWTLMWVTPTVTLTAALYTALVPKQFLRHLGRVVMAHLVWYGTTTLIDGLDRYVGECSDAGITSIRACTKAGHQWTGFDVSGHIFFMAYCVFIITEEAANVKLEVWREYDNTLTMERQVVKKAKKLEWWLTNTYQVGGHFVEALELCGLSLVLLWSSVVMATSLYFHTFLEKLVGLGVGVLVWWLTYGLAYRAGEGCGGFLPCQTSHGRLHPLKHIKSQQH